MDGLLTFLGTGTSMGVPTLGCGCAVCTSADPHDRRLRPSVLLRWHEQAAGERVVVIDTGPDFREQALRAGLTRVDAVFYTHSHADHILGMDDLRPLSFTAFREGGPIPLYASAETSGGAGAHLRVHLFAARHLSDPRPGPTGAAGQSAHSVHGVEFLRVPLLHGEMEIAGFRFGRAAYLTDVSAIPEASFALLEGLDHLSCSPRCATSRIPATPPWSRRLGWARRIGARQTWLTHIAHELGHEETNRTLPEGVAWPTTA